MTSRQREAAKLTVVGRLLVGVGVAQGDAASFAAVVHEGTADVGTHVGEATVALFLLVDALGALVGVQAERVEKTSVGSFLALRLEWRARDDLLDVVGVS